MGIESLRRLWARPLTRWSHRAAGVADRAAATGAARARRGFDFDAAQAQALCDLVADPTSGITRVTVVGAGPRLLDAIEDVAAEGGVVLDEARRTAGRSRSATLGRAGTPAAGELADR
jgi:hypothetical protein